MQTLKSADEDELRRMREQVGELQREREELLKAADNKHKLTELEAQLASMKRRYFEAQLGFRV